MVDGTGADDVGPEPPVENGLRAETVGDHGVDVDTGPDTHLVQEAHEVLGAGVACETELVFDVPPESFSPAPKVMSSIVRLVPHTQPPVVVDSVKMLNTVVTTAFSQRRKTLRNSLKKLIIEADIISLDINPTLRAETISLQDYAKLSQYINQHPLELGD